MLVTEQDKTLMMRRAIEQVARRIGIAQPEHLDEVTQLLPMLSAQDNTAFSLLSAYRTAFGKWHDQSLVLRQAAHEGLPLDNIREELSDLAKTRDITFRDLVRYLDNHYIHSTTLLTA